MGDRELEVHSQIKANVLRVSSKIICVICNVHQPVDTRNWENKPREGNRSGAFKTPASSFSPDFPNWEGQQMNGGSPQDGSSFFTVHAKAEVMTGRRAVLGTYWSGFEYSQISSQ